jgi:hypothetical protein
MLGQQHWQSVPHPARLRRLVLCLLILGSLGLIPPVLAEPGFTNKSIRGTWVLSATGRFASSGSADAPFALVGLATFERGSQCALTLSINAGGTNWSASATTCTFSVQEDGTGTLQATFANTHPVPFPPLALFFVIVNDDEILAIRTDDVVASGMFRRQVK